MGASGASTQSTPDWLPCRLVKQPSGLRPIHKQQRRQGAPLLFVSFSLNLKRQHLAVAVSKTIHSRKSGDVGVPVQQDDPALQHLLAGQGQIKELRQRQATFSC